MFCTKCGREIDDNSKFCTFCGASNETKQQSELKIEKSKKKKTKILWIVLIIIVFCFIGMQFMDDSETEPKNPTEKWGKLGEDCSVVDLLEDGENKEITFTGTYWTKRQDKRYVFLYKVKNSDGTQQTVDIFVRDNTEDEVLSALDDVSYEEKKKAEITAIVTKVYTDEDGSVFCEVSATQARLLDESESKKIEGNYYYVGDTIELNNGVIFRILDTGTYADMTGKFIYFEMEIDNQGDEGYSLSNSNVLFYGDDYEMETGYPIDEGANQIVVSDIAVGRKASGRFYAKCPNYDALSTIEVEFANINDLIIVIKGEPQSTDSISNDDSTSNIASNQDTSSNFNGDLGTYQGKRVNDDFNGRIEFGNVIDNQIPFTLYVFELEYNVMTANATIIDDCTAQYSDENLTITFKWTNSRELIVTNSGTYMGMDADVIDITTDNIEYVWSEEFN